jgi:hypothetical protein
MALDECPQVRTTDRTSSKPAKLQVNIAQPPIRDTTHAPRRPVAAITGNRSPLLSCDSFASPDATRTEHPRLLSAGEEVVYCRAQELTRPLLAIPPDAIFLGAARLIPFRILVTFRNLGHPIRVGFCLCARSKANDHRPRMRTPEKPNNPTTEPHSFRVERLSCWQQSKLSACSSSAPTPWLPLSAHQESYSSRERAFFTRLQFVSRCLLSPLSLPSSTSGCCSTRGVSGAPEQRSGVFAPSRRPRDGE